MQKRVHRSIISALVWIFEPVTAWKTITHKKVGIRPETQALYRSSPIHAILP